MKYLLPSAALLAGVVFAGSAFAQEGRGDRFYRLDADGDGKVAVSELDAKHQDILKNADADGDGFITKEEMQVLRATRRAERQAKRFPDANKDGVVDASEFEAAAKERFEKLDTNGNGELTQEEMSAGKKRMRYGKQR